MTTLLLRTTIATLVAYAGGALGVALGQRAMRRLNLLVYAAMGVLLAVTLCDILPDAKALLGWPAFLLAAASGYGLFWLVGRYVYHICPSCAISSFDEETTRRLGQTAVLLMIALSIHSTMDGIAVVVGDKITGHLNLAVLFAVSFHKLPEGLALAVLLLGAGYARRTALLWTWAIETTTEFGGLIGIFALKGASLPVLGLLFAHVGGGFVYLIASTIGAFLQRRPGQSFKQLAAPMVVSTGLAFALTTSLFYVLRVYGR